MSIWLIQRDCSLLKHFNHGKNASPCLIILPLSKIRKTLIQHLYKLFQTISILWKKKDGHGSKWRIKIYFVEFHNASGIRCFSWLRNILILNVTSVINLLLINFNKLIMLVLRTEWKDGTCSSFAIGYWKFTFYSYSSRYVYILRNG